MKFEMIALTTSNEEASWIRCLLAGNPLWEKPLPYVLIYCDSIATNEMIVNCYYNGDPYYITETKSKTEKEPRDELKNMNLQNLKFKTHFFIFFLSLSFIPLSLSLQFSNSSQITPITPDQLVLALRICPSSFLNFACRHDLQLVEHSQYLLPNLYVLPFCWKKACFAYKALCQ
ncbi:hypothetical protein MTR_7g445200 [Medicago truncatula]|uniref:Uncharacterized protein n=1 Tax=Medicago truncatula TaxID=3880 RepID=A0A072TZT3_MEDTR|nr:hypothetical protein MTR_7g445200 [Medicago truncatula]